MSSRNNMTQKTQQDHHHQQAMMKRRNSIGCEREVVENPMIYSSFSSTCEIMSDTSLFDLSSSSLGSWFVVDDDDDDDDDIYHLNNNCYYYPDNVVGQQPPHLVGVGGDVVGVVAHRRYSWSYSSSFSIQHANDIFEREVQQKKQQKKKNQEEYHHNHHKTVFFDDDDFSSNKEKDDGHNLVDHSSEVVIVATTRPPQKMLLPRCEKQQEEEEEDKYQLMKMKKTTKTKKKTKKKKVRFSKIAEMRNYPITIGDNPSVENGPPLSIEWEYMSTDIVEVPLFSWRYSYRSFPRRRSNQERVELLISLGYNRSEINYYTIQASTIRTQMKLTRKETKLFSFVQEQWQRTCRKMSNLVTFGRLKRQERTYLKQSGCFPTTTR